MRIARYFPSLLLAVTAWGQTCLPYNRLVTIQGSLSRVDENGYREWIALEPDRPICTVADPNDRLAEAESDISGLQVLIDDDQQMLSNRVRKLVGYNVKAQGKLSHMTTGYHRTAVMIDLTTLEAVDERGRAALRAPERMKPPLRDVAAYEIVVRAGDRLQKEAVEIGTRRQLTPIEAYAPHWVTGGDVVYLNCRDGYDMSPGPVMPAVNMPEGGETVIRAQCVRRRN
jgi:hypothetical protein